jgi:hypothetical protein
MAVFLPVTQIVSEKQNECKTNSICGPAGGEVNVDDPQGYLYGARVVIPPGALDSERSFWIEEASGTGPSLPVGFFAYPNGIASRAIFQLWTGGDLPYDLGLYFYFPVQGMTNAAGDIPSAFAYDERTGKWGIVLPDAIDANIMTVRTNYREKWRWGKIVLHEVEKENLVPVLEEKLGKENWAAIAVKFNEFFNHPEVQQVELTCSSLTNYRNIFLESMKQNYRQELEIWQAQFGYRCGLCDVFSEKFLEGLKLWVAEEVLTYVVQVLIENQDLSIKQAFAAVLTLFVYDTFVKFLYQCDYECLAKEGGFLFWFDVAAYYTCIVWQEAIDRAISTGWITCP